MNGPIIDSPPETVCVDCSRDRNLRPYNHCLHDRGRAALQGPRNGLRLKRGL